MSSNVAQTPEFRLTHSLTPFKRPVNVLAFVRDGSLLALGGDDEYPLLWEGKSGQFLQRDQFFAAQRLGQITAISWMYPPVQSSDSSWTLCVGTGKGYVTVYTVSHLASKSPVDFKKTKHKLVFEGKDGVEGSSFDGLNDRLALISHAGHIEMFRMDADNNLISLWKVSRDGIPHGICFYGNTNEHLIVHRLETGEMFCHNASDGQMVWKKELIGGTAEAILSNDRRVLLVNNLTSGKFDRYAFPDTVPILSLQVSSRRRFTKQCAFVGARQAACGSDDGLVYVYDLETGVCLHKLHHDEAALIQVIATMDIHDTHIIVGASSLPPYKICIWMQEKPKPQPPFQDPTLPSAHVPAQLAVPINQHAITTSWKMHVAYVLAFLWINAATYNLWSPWLWQAVDSVSSLIPPIQSPTPPAIHYGSPAGERDISRFAAVDDVVTDQDYHDFIEWQQIKQSIHAANAGKHTRSSGKEEANAVSSSKNERLEEGLPLSFEGPFSKHKEEPVQP